MVRHRSPAPKSTPEPERAAAHHVAHEVVSRDGAESEAQGWARHSAFGALRVAAMPRGDGARLPRLLGAAWPLLEDGAIEVRWLQRPASPLECALVIRATADDKQRATDELIDRMTAVKSLAEALLPGWELTELDAVAVAALLEPFSIAAGGDLLRRELDVSLADDTRVDVPLLLGADSDELALLVKMMATTPGGCVLSLAAAPTHVDIAERAVLDKELAQLERAIDTIPVGIGPGGSLTDPPQNGSPRSAVALAAAVLQRRTASSERLGFLRVSLATELLLQPALLAAAQEALAASWLALQWTPACDPCEASVFARNLATLGFEPWGVQAEEQPGHETVNDCYLASLEEILSELAIPSPDGFLPLACTSLDPAPRPVPNAVPDQGRLLGLGMGRRPVALTDEDRMRHTYLVGQTGTGKSTLLLNLALQDINAGAGVCVIDPHGDLVEAILDRFPRDRAEDLILFDPGNMERPVAMNLLDAKSPTDQDFVVQQMINMLYRIYDPGHTGIMGPRFEHWFRNAALTVMAPPDGGTLLDIPRLFTNDAFLVERLRHVKEPSVRSFWVDEMGRTSDYHRSEMLGWFVAKFGAFMSNRLMRSVIGQNSSTISMPEVMDSGKVLLVKLPRGVLGETNAMWLGLIFIVKTQMAALARASVPASERRTFNMYVDEFQNFALADFDALIAEARKYGLALTLAHQHVGQLSERLRNAVFGNVGTLIAFRLGLDDAAAIGSQFEGYSERDLTRLANYNCVVRTGAHGRVLPPFGLTTLAPDERLTGRELRTALLHLSGLKYGRPQDLVDAEYEDSWTRREPEEKTESDE